MSTQETEINTETFKNDELNVVVTKLPNCRYKFAVNIQPKAVEAAYTKASKNVKKEVSIPGFRKGKAPDNIIMEKYQSHIHREWVDLVLETGFNEAIQLTNIHPLKDGLVKRPTIHECSKEKGANFEVEFEARPVVPEVNFKDIKINKVTPKVITEKDKEQYLHQLALRFTTYEPLENHAVKENDFVDLDVDVKEDGKTRKAIHNQRTQVNEEGLPSWIRKKVIGLKAGESAEGMSEPDPKQPVENFKPIPFIVKVDMVLKGTIPPYDDELAKKVGLTTFAELQDKINEKLEKEAIDIAHEKEQQQIEQVLLEKFPVDIPQSLIEKNTKMRMEDYYNQLKSEGQEATYRKNRENVEKSFEKAISHQLQMLFLLRKIADDNKIEISSDDVTNELNRQVALMSSGQSSLDFQSDNKDELRDRLYSLAMDRKIKLFLAEKATRV
ncbi:MAG: trigger factor [Parachlamydiaceae bacterium]|nr:trigger factor [Parachlamydiaceae bacterium]